MSEESYAKLLLLHKPCKAQGVGDDEEGGKAHGGRSDHGVQGDACEGKHARRERDPDTVVEKRPEEVLLDDAHRPFREADRLGQRTQIPVDEDDVGALDGDVGAPAHRNADVRLLQGRGVVDAVAHHRDVAVRPPCGAVRLFRRLVLFARVAHIYELIFGEKFGAHTPLIGRKARLRGDMSRHGLVVAREHNGQAPKRSELFDGRAAPFLQGICEGEKGQNAFLIREKEHRFPLFGEGVVGGKVFLEPHVFFLHHAGIPEEVTLAVDDARGTHAREVLHIFALLPPLAVFRDTIGERVGELAFEGICDALCARRVFLEKDDFGRALGEGRRLIEKDLVHRGKFLQGFRILEEDAQPRAPARCRHHGDGGREPQGAGTGDDDDAHAVVEGICEIARHQDPHEEGDEGEPDDDGHEYRRDLIGELLDGRLGSARLAHHADDAREHRVLAHLFRLDFEMAARDDEGADRLLPFKEFDGEAFARHGGGIDEGVAGEDGAVDGDALALLHDDDISHLDLGHGYGLFRPVALDGDRIGGEGAKFFELLARAFLALIFKPFAEGDEGDDHRRRFEKDSVRRRVERNGDDAVYEGDGRAEGNKRIHIGDALHDRTHAAHKEGVVHEEDGERQRDLGRVVPPAVRNDRIADHVPHRKVHFGNEQGERDEKT